MVLSFIQTYSIKCIKKDLKKIIENEKNTEELENH